MKKRLKIGLFIDTFFPMIDGVIMVVDNYARRLSEYCDVVVFAPVGRSKYDDSKLPYRVVRCTKKLPLKFLDYDLPLPKQDRKFLKTLKEENLDLVHIHSPFSMGKVGIKYAKKHNVPTVATMHSQFKQDFKKATKSNMITNIMIKTIMKVFNSCDECWAVNDEIARIFLKYGAKKLPKTQNNGTEISYFEDFKEIDALRKKHEIKKHEKVLLFIGRLTALKNIFFILESLKILKEKNFPFKMIYVGNGPDKNKLEKDILKLGLEKDVILTGSISDRKEITKYYRLADLFLFPSLYDASSLVQIEAASQKTPTLFLKGAATAATVTENVNGFISENSTKEYAEKIISIFSDQKFYETISENAFKDLYISWDDAVKKTFKDYESVIRNYNKGEKNE